MKAIKKICKGIDKVNDILGQIFSVLVLGILAIILVEVFMRRLLSKPQIWTQDMIVMLFAAYTILISAYGFQKKAFVAVDVLYAKLPERVQYLLHIATYIVFLVPFVGMILPKSWNFFMKAFLSGEKSYSVWAAPTWPVKFCFFLGLLLLTIQTVSEILKKLTAFVDDVKGIKEVKE